LAEMSGFWLLPARTAPNVVMDSIAQTSFGGGLLFMGSLFS